MATLLGSHAQRRPLTRRAARPGRGRRRALLWVLNLFFLFFFLFPFYWQTVTALKPPLELYAQPIVWFPSHLYWGHFADVFTGVSFIQNVVNSVIVASCTTVVSLLIGALAAYALA